MRLQLIIAAAALAAQHVSAATAQSLSVNPGKWESSHVFNGKVETQGMTMNIPSNTHTSTQCITEEDATFKPEQMSGEGCSPSNVTQSGNSISFDIVCNQNGASMKGSMDAERTADGNSVSGTMTMSGSQAGGGSMAMTGEFESRRVGSCSG